MTNKKKYPPIDYSKFDLESYVGEFAERNNKASRDGDAWFKCCFHDEKSASLHVTGKQIFSCHGCGVGGGILDFVRQVNEINTKDAIEIILAKSGQETVAMNTYSEPTPFFEPSSYEAQYSYNGGFVLKYRLGGGKYTWANFTDGQWWVGTGDHDIKLYAPNGLQGVVVMAEGEKDADILCEMGFNGASSPNGTYKWKDSYTEELLESQMVALLCDNDYPGISGQELCQHYLKQENILTKRINPLEIEPNDKQGYDISDVVDLLGLDETRIRLQAIIDDENMWGVSWNDTEPNETVEVEIVYDSGLGEEYDNLMQQAVQETMHNGDVNELTWSNLVKVGKKHSLGIKYLKDKIKSTIEENKPKRNIVEMKSDVIKVKELDKNIDITGSGYYISGKSGEIYDGNENEVLGHMLSVVGVVVDAELEQDKNVKVALAYNTPQNFSDVKLMVVPKKTLATTKDIVPYLSGYNINVTQVNAAQLVEYLQDLQNHFNENMPILKSLSRFGWFEDKLMPFEQENSGLIFDPTVAQPVANKLTTPTGDKELSRELIREIAQHSNSATVTIGAAVGSLIASYMNDGGNQSFALNLWGGTSTGKSVLCQGVASMFGYPFKDGGWWGDGNGTENKDMYHNALLGNLPNFIDDPALLRGYDAAKKRDYIYTATSGQSRGRMQRDGQTAQDIKTWNNVMIMTNETQFIDDSVADGGAKARCIEVFFDKVLDQEKINRWIELMGNNYGHFAIDIANKIRELGKVKLEEQWKKYIHEFNLHGVDGKRAINAATIMIGLRVADLAIGLEPIKPEAWLIKQIRGSGELSDGQRGFIKLINRIEVSGGVYRAINDRDGVYVGSFGEASDGRRVVNLPYRTIAKYAKEDGYNPDSVIDWGYRNDRMVKKFNEFDKPVGITVESTHGELRVIQVYYDWDGQQVIPESFNYLYTTKEERNEV